MKKISISILIILLCISLFITFPCKAATVWSDDFNDGNYDGWTVMNGTFSVEDGKLKAGPGDYNVIVCPSYSPAYGTWSFDVLTKSVGLDMAIVFIGTYPIYYTVYPIPNQGFVIISSSMGGALLLRKFLNGSTSTSTPPGFYVSSSAWQHINITRNQDGRICIYDNGTLVRDVTDNSVIPTSKYFAFYSARGAIIDNIVVSDTVDIQPPAAPFYTQTWFYAAVGVVAIVAVAIVVLLMRRK
jgi:hypothetical protein